MSDFNNLLAEYTSREDPKVHGVICKCVDIHGTEIYSKVAGYNSPSADSPPLDENAVVKLASATKLITSIALLQCVDKGLIGLDEPLTKILPEFENKEILTAVSGSEFSYKPNKTPVTARHLLTHTSGLGYWFLNPLLKPWAEARNQRQGGPSFRVTERFSYPLVFEPGTAWLYGCNLDWAGVVISRLNGGVTLEEYFVENIWKPLGLQAPFPRFNIGIHPEYNAKTMGGALCTPEGKLVPNDECSFDNLEDQDGGSGLSSTAKDFLAVLSDLVSDSPKLLKLETITEMFHPQLEPNSESTKKLLELRAAWGLVSGAVANDAVNHGLGGVLCVGDVPQIGQPGNVLVWGGASNVVWWANRELHVAGFFATQLTPFATSPVVELVNAWKKDFWSQWNSTYHA